MGFLGLYREIPFLILEHFQLLISCRIGCFLLFPIVEDKGFSILFVCNAEYRNSAMDGHHASDAIDMHFCMIHTGALAHIHRVLKHSKTITHHVLTETGSIAAMLLRIGGKVEQDYYPHNTVFV